MNVRSFLNVIDRFITLLGGLSMAFTTIYAIDHKQTRTFTYIFGIVAALLSILSSAAFTLFETDQKRPALIFISGCVCVLEFVAVIFGTIGTTWKDYHSVTPTIIDWVLLANDGAWMAYLLLAKTRNWEHPKSDIEMALSHTTHALSHATHNQAHQIHSLENEGANLRATIHHAHVQTEIALSNFHCLFCHGYEQRGSPSSGVLAVNDVAPIPLALHVSRNAAQLTKSVIIYTNGNVSHAAEIQAAIGPIAPFTVDSRRITKLVLGPDQIGLTIHFEDGNTKDEAFLSHKPTSKIKSSFLAEQLGLELTPQGDLKVNPPFGETNLSGCFAAGDNSSFLKTSPNAVNSGANSAAGTASHVQSRMYGQVSLGEFMQKMPKK